MNYQSRRDRQHALRTRMRELAASRVRFGYRRLTVLLRREGWAVNPKRIYRLYTEDGLAVRTKVRKKIARRARVLLLADSSLNGHKVALALSQVIAERGAPVSITVDNELSKKAMAGSEHTSARAREASSGLRLRNSLGTVNRRCSLRVGAPSRVRSRSSPADAALDRRRHCG